MECRNLIKPDKAAPPATWPATPPLSAAAAGMLLFLSTTTQKEKSSVNGLKNAEKASTHTMRYNESAAWRLESACLGPEAVRVVSHQEARCFREAPDEGEAAFLYRTGGRRA